MENVKAIKATLWTFELALGLKINFTKSYFGAIGMSDGWKLEAAGCLNSSLLSIPFVYLGIPIGANPRRYQMWGPILKKCERKLTRIPKKVMDKLVSIQRRFLWGGGLEQNKIAWIKWETVCLPKDKGDLGIKDINTFNLALLGKWKWNLFQHEGQLWVRVLESKYGGWRSLDEVPHGNNESIWWRDLKVAFQNSQQGADVQNSILWRVGCGDRIKFWEDKWLQFWRQHLKIQIGRAHV